MRCALVTVALFASSSSGSVVLRRQDIPACAASCFAPVDISACPNVDDACICSNPTMIGSLLSCFEASCSGADLTAAEQTVQGLCDVVGVTLSNIPTGSATAAVPPPVATTVTKTASSSSSAAVSSPVVLTVTTTDSSSATATKPATSSAASVSQPAATSASTSGSPPPLSPGPAPDPGTKSAASIVGVSSLTGWAAFGLALLTL